MELTQTAIMLRIGVSILLGAAIGFEREARHHAAGLRTFMIICLGSTLATLASIYICQTNMDRTTVIPGVLLHRC